MKSSFSLISFITIVLVTGILTACSTGGAETVSDASMPLTTQGVAFSEPMDSNNTTDWDQGNWTNGSMFNCGWLPDHISFTSSIMTLKLDSTGSSGRPYSSGEYRTKAAYPYGAFETSMKAAKAPGTVSSFFLYTGSPWDEIDIEILGKDTTKAQFNFFVDGLGGNEKIVDLGFDSSVAFHTYAIEWSFGIIKWYIDGVQKWEVNSATGTNVGLGKKMPNHPMQVMVNLWPGIGVDAWLGPFNYTQPLYASYNYIKYTPKDMSK